jgi:hypothetical protein
MGRTLRELEAHSDTTTSEALSELPRPGIDDLGSMFEHEGFGLGRPGNLKADVVLTVGPVDADEGRELGLLFLHGNLLDLGSGRDMQSRAQRMQYGEPVKAAFPECSLRAKAHPRVRSRVSDHPGDRRCRFVARGCMSRFSLPSSSNSFKKPNGQPIMALQRTIALPRCARAGARR